MRAFVVVGLAVLLCACATISTARLYDLETAYVIEATFRDGFVSIGDPTNPDGCTGEYSTVDDGSTSWGTIFSGTKSASVVGGESSNAQRGQAVATCRNGVVIECEYVTNWQGTGHGACRDNYSRRYRLMF